MTRASIRQAWRSDAGGRQGLIWALMTARNDGEGLPFTKARLREVLTATQDHAVTAANAVEIRFLRWLGRTWLDAPDRPARAIARRLIADHLTQMTAEATP